MQVLQEATEALEEQNKMNNIPLPPGTPTLGAGTLVCGVGLEVND